MCRFSNNVQADRLDAHRHQPLTRQRFEHRVEYPSFGSATQARISSVLGAVMAWQSPPSATVGGHGQDGVEHIKVVQAHVAALARQQIRDPFEWFAG